MNETDKSKVLIKLNEIILESESGTHQMDVLENFYTELCDIQTIVLQNLEDGFINSSIYKAKVSVLDAVNFLMFESISLKILNISPAGQYSRYLSSKENMREKDFYQT